MSIQRRARLRPVADSHSLIAAPVDGPIILGDVVAAERASQGLRSALGQHEAHRRGSWPR